jgi:hypothetical protein
MIQNPSIKSRLMEKSVDHASRLDTRSSLLPSPQGDSGLSLKASSTAEKQKELHHNPNESFREPNLNELAENFEKEISTLRETSPLKVAKISKNAFGNLTERFMNDPNFRSASISGINAFLHSLTVATGFTPGLKKVNEVVDKSAFFFTKIISPFVSFGISSVSAFMNKKPIESFIKAIPPLLLPLVGDANVDTPFGLCFGLNQPYDVIMGRIEQKSKESAEFANHVKNQNQTSLGNAKLILEETKRLFKDLFRGKLNFWNESGYILNCSMMLAGSLPIFLFARNQRNTALVTGLGILRNVGGILGDFLFVCQKASFHKLLVGILCSLGAMSNITKRLVSNDGLARMFIHLGAALDVAAYTIWNAWSDKKEAPAATVA